MKPSMHARKHNYMGNIKPRIATRIEQPIYSKDEVTGNIIITGMQTLIFPVNVNRSPNIGKDAFNGRVIPTGVRLAH